MPQTQTLRFGDESEWDPRAGPFSDTMLLPSPIPPSGSAKSPLTSNSVHSRSLAPLLNELPSESEAGVGQNSSLQDNLKVQPIRIPIPLPNPLQFPHPLSPNYPRPHSLSHSHPHPHPHPHKSTPLSHPNPYHSPNPNPTCSSNSTSNSTSKSTSNSTSTSNPSFKHPSPIDSNPTLSPSPPTPPAIPHHSDSPSSYHAYQPEWTSVSSPVLASRLDHHSNNLHPPPPRKKHRQIPIGPHSPPHIPFDHNHHHHHHNYHLAHHHLPTAPNRSASANHLKPLGSSDQLQPVRPRNVPSPTSSHDNDDVPPHHHHHRHLDDHHDSLTHPVTLPRSMILDEDRGLSSRPLKNTKRAAQNRAAQRAFRERKDRYVRELETRSAQFEEFMLRHSSLDERERALEAREAGAMYLELNKPGASARDLEGKRAKRDEYVDRLQQEIKSLQREVVRLRGELVEANGVKLEQGGWQAAESVSGARLEDGPRRLSGSSGSSAMGGTEPCTEPGAQLAGRRVDQNPRSSRASGLTEGVEVQEIDEYAERRPSESKPPLTIMIDGRAKAAQGARSTWSEGIASPDSLMYQPYSAPAHAEYHCQHRLNRPTGHHPPTIRRALTLDSPQPLIRLPAIQHRSDDYWWTEGRRSRRKHGI